MNANSHKISLGPHRRGHTMVAQVKQGVGDYRNENMDFPD